MNAFDDLKRTDRLLFIIKKKVYVSIDCHLGTAEYGRRPLN